MTNTEHNTSGSNEEEAVYKPVKLSVSFCFFYYSSLTPARTAASMSDNKRNKQYTQSHSFVNQAFTKKWMIL